ncbi:MAG: hypothetical protein RLY85_220 [Bacteroidota bacterium]
MSDIAIKVENLSKLYQLGEVGTGTISHDLNRWWAKVRGKEDPYTKVGRPNDRTKKGDSDFVWALKDINFEVKQGEVLGIIGRNGAGKSTLLKILSKITSPTTGRVYTKGKIASLLEVGTGFHPEMTGRENIYLNGAILGMRKWEIDKKFDEIVDFAGVEAYIDTPVKRYSSGMYVRLAFAVAAFLEPEILIVDEVLAVGDAEFQKKCLGRMKDVSVNDGRTVLFVSHQMGAIAKLCNKSLLIEKGTLKRFDKTGLIIEEYLSPSDGIKKEKNCYTVPEELAMQKSIYFKCIKTLNASGKIADSFGFDDSIILGVEVVAKRDIKNVILGIGLQDKYNVRVATFLRELTQLNSDDVQQDLWKIEVALPKGIIAPNAYNFTFALYIPYGFNFDQVESLFPVKIYDTGTDFSRYEGIDFGNVIVEAEWKLLP